MSPNTSAAVRPRSPRTTPAAETSRGPRSKLPRDRFYASASSRGFARLNVFDLGTPIYDQPQGGALYQGYLVADEIVGDHLILYMGFEDRLRHRFFVPINLGSIARAADQSFLARTGFLMSDWTRSTEARYRTTAMYQVLDRWVGDYFYFDLEVVNFKYAPKPWPSIALRSEAEARASGPVTKALIAWTQKTVKQSYRKVQMPAAVKRLVNRRVTKFFAEMPTVWTLTPYEDLVPT